MRQIFILGSLILLMGCNQNENGKNAHGHFEAREIIISPETMGRLLQFDLQEGQQVEEKELLAIVDTSQLHMQKEQVLASMEAIKAKTLVVGSELAVLEANRDYLANEVVRMQKLLDAEAITQMQFDELKSKKDQVDRQIEAVRIKLQNTNRGILAELNPLKARIKQIDDQIVKSRIFSPANGTILKTYSEESEMAAPGKPLCTLAELKLMELRVYMTAKQLAGITVGDEYSVGYTASENQLMGKVTSISSEAEFTPKNVQTAEEKENLVYSLTLSVPNNGDLRIGMPGWIIVDD